MRKDEEAVGELRRAIEANRNFAVAHFYLAVALAELGRLDEARLEAREGLSIDPTFTIRRYRGDAPSDNPVFLDRAAAHLRNDAQDWGPGRISFRNGKALLAARLRVAQRQRLAARSRTGVSISAGVLRI